MRNNIDSLVYECVQHGLNRLAPYISSAFTFGIHKQRRSFA